MNFFLTVVVIIFCSPFASGQQENYTDVPGLLQNLSAATTDTARIILKCRLAEAYRSNDPDTSFILANEALSASTKLGFKKGEVRSLVVFCVLYREKGDLPHALDLGLKALNIAEKEQMAYEQVYCLIRIAVVYIAVKDIPKGVTYLRKADEVLKNNYDEFQWAVTQYFLGDAYEQMNDLDAAEKQVEIIVSKPPSFPGWPIISRRLMARIAGKRNRLPLAIKYYRESNEMAMSQHEFREAATTCNAMALAFKKMGEPDSAIFYAKQGLRLGQMLSYKNRILDASNLLAELYAEKDPKEAVKYYQIASAARDSLYGVQKVLQLQSSTMKEQERQVEAEAARLAYRNRVRQWALLGGIAMFTAIASILYRNNRQKQKSNRVLATTLTNLRATQAQLIQSEKMASLGELTAGIAHEIQNPLNFVNNFSEVSHELVDEMKEQLTMGNRQQAMGVADDIKQNLGKISHHGKRAEAIVKSMMQHARAVSGNKETTDINGLVDEYLRLAYHGTRAKDKSFNAKIETHFDVRAGKINVVPGEIGRVIFNLVHNAFYAVDEKRKQVTNTQGEQKYEPVVFVSSERVNDNVKITVKDNGNGIPEKIRDKIFQPFFTTKPTGQGTGLGLSLAYDIVKAHGGEIRVDTTVEEGTRFTILLPL